MTIEEALKVCDEILLDIDELPERAEDYVISISPVIEGIREWIEENRHVTEKQLQTIENIRNGVSKWMS